LTYILLLKDDQTDHNYVKDTNFTYFVNRGKLKIVSLVVSNIIQELLYAKEINSKQVFKNKSLRQKLTKLILFNNV